MLDEKEDEKAVAEPAEEYVRPRLTLIGNLNQLLASGGTRDADSGVCVTGTGTDVDPSCN